ncbi:hypothetical protein SDC9_118164 [bioreactor metagenome]|uniref:Uncharacterized protein n=1 Tax=bioreactor metagenome TaxID=1076179 RepID=A0A645C2M8_9ZZZZ
MDKRHLVLVVIVTDELLVEHQVGFRRLQFIRVHIRQLFVLSDDIIADITDRTADKRQRDIVLKIGNRHMLFYEIEHLAFFVHGLSIGDGRHVFAHTRDALVRIRTQKRVPPDFPLRKDALEQKLMLPFKIVVHADGRQLIRIDRQVYRKHLILFF